MALAEAPHKPLLGHAKPRIAPPLPARSLIEEYKAIAAEIGITLMPWQETAARYLTAIGPEGNWLYREVCIVVARQNGKTTLLLPLIVQRLRMGHRIMHSAQNRRLPLEVFERAAEVLARDLTLFPTRANGRQQLPKFGQGAEGVSLTNGGSYRVAAATRGGARGPSNDTVIVDELREFESFEFDAAAGPTLSASKTPQKISLSNAGTEDSVVLNALRDRAAEDPNLAYLEWSAGAERQPDDPEGWAESNPSMGHEPDSMGSLYATLEADYLAANLSGTMANFETEHLCRWVTTMSPRLINDAQWQQRKATLEHPRMPVMAVSMQTDGSRASAVAGWQQSDGTIALRLVADVTGSPIDTDKFTNDLVALSQKRGIRMTGFDAKTDAEMARYFLKERTKAIVGTEYTNASAAFVRFVEGGRIRWDGDDTIGADLAFIARKDVDTGWQAVPAKDDRPVTAGLAAIRAAWLVSVRRPTKLRLY